MKKLLLLSLFVSFVLLSCKKGLQADNYNKEELFEKFLTLPPNASIEAKRIKQKLLSEQEKNNFINKLIEKEGLPVWNKLQIKRSINKNAASRTESTDSTGSANSDTLVLVPLVMPNAENVNSFLAVKLSGIVQILLFSGRDYDEYPFDKDNATIMTAEKIAIELMIMDKDVFGYEDFTITDNRLFSKELNEKLNATIPLKDILETNVELKEELQNISLGGGNAARFVGHCITYKYDHCDGRCTGACDASTGCPAGTCYVAYETVCTGDYGPMSDRGGSLLDLLGGNYNWNNTGGGSGGSSSTGGLGWNSTAALKIWAELTTAQKNYLNNNSTIKQQLLIQCRKYNFDDYALIATQSMVDALINNVSNGPYNQTFFDSYVLPYLQVNPSNISNTAFMEYFEHQKMLENYNNPTANLLSNAWYAMRSTIEMASKDDDDLSNQKYRDPAKFDNTIYAPYNTSIPLPLVPDLLQDNQFIEWYTYANCLDLCEKQIAKKNCIMTNGYDVTPHTDGTQMQTFKVLWNTKKDASGIDLKDDNNLLRGMSFIVSALQKGIPVIVGIDRCEGTKNDDGVTEHFIVIIGIGEDAYGRYFRFYDNGKNKTEGTKSSLKLRYVSGKGLVAGWGTASQPKYDETYKVSQIRICVKD